FGGPRDDRRVRLALAARRLGGRGERPPRAGERPRRVDRHLHRDPGPRDVAGPFPDRGDAHPGGGERPDRRRRAARPGRPGPGRAAATGRAVRALGARRGGAAGLGNRRVSTLAWTGGNTDEPSTTTLRGYDL